MINGVLAQRLLLQCQASAPDNKQEVGVMALW